VISLWALPVLRSSCFSFGLVKCTMYVKTCVVEKVSRLVWFVEKCSLFAEWFLGFTSPVVG
jgi:hypothetical protein